jgi:L-asparaginase
MGDDGRMLSALPGLGYAGLVVEGMGLGHVPAEVAPILGELTTRIPVVLASRVMTCPVFTRTYGYPGSEIDLIARSVVPPATSPASRRACWWASPCDRERGLAV